MQTSRRSFLRGLAKIAVTIQAAPALKVVAELTAVPLEFEEAAWASRKLMSFDEMLNEYLGKEWLLAELTKPNWLLERVKKKEIS